MTEFDKNWGYTRKNKENRPLTEAEHELLESQRQRFIERAEGFVRVNNQKWQQVLEGTESKFELESEVEVTFDSEKDWAEFLDWQFDEYGHLKGLNFGLSGISMSLRAQPWLVRLVKDQFHLRPLKIEDFEEVAGKQVSPFA